MNTLENEHKCLEATLWTLTSPEDSSPDCNGPWVCFLNRNPWSPISVQHHPWLQGHWGTRTVLTQIGDQGWPGVQTGLHNLAELILSFQATCRTELVGSKAWSRSCLSLGWFQSQDKVKTWLNISVQFSRSVVSNSLRPHEPQLNIRRDKRKTPLILMEPCFLTCVKKAYVIDHMERTKWKICFQP